MTKQGIVLSLFGRSDVGTTRTNDEDSFVISDLSDSVPIHAMSSTVALRVNERGILVAVSDGMGGAHGGEVASSLVVGALHEGMSTVKASNAEAALRESVEAANLRVVETAQASGHEGMGATLTAVLFHGIYAYIAEIGDSRAYLLRSNRIVQLTRDQSYVQELIDSGSMTREQAEASDYKNVILQAMGLNPNISVPLNRISIRRHDRFLVCSDGLSGKLGDQEMMAIVLQSATLESACSALIALAVDHGSEDDITVVLAQVDGDGAPAMTEPERLSIETSKVFAPH
ncbi:MAG: serine/threonine-protein phosphatase [Deltaproteobacteria bacterium]|nr:serine/threonine-protein phosphatase [Deltaproteobacteria bacterium]